MCHTRELAFQISKEYERFSKFLSNVKVSVIAVPTPEIILKPSYLHKLKGLLSSYKTRAVEPLKSLRPFGSDSGTTALTKTLHISQYECTRPSIQVGVFFGGLAITKDEQVLKNNCPHIVVGTPGRILG